MSPSAVPPPAAALIAASGGGAYVALVVVHVVAAVVAFGGIGFAGVYAGTAAHLDRPGALDEARRWFRTPNRAVLALPLVPVLGILALVAGGRAGQLGHAWTIAALVVWVLVGGVVVRVVQPAERQIRRLLIAEHVDDAEHETVDGAAVAVVARRLARAAAGCDVAFVVALALMIWQPG